MPRRLKLLLKVAGVMISSLLFSPSTLAVTPDDSLSTTVERSGTESLIDGGARSGDNLFHSFSDFSVPESGSASFNNASDIVNIFNRVQRIRATALVRHRSEGTLPAKQAVPLGG